MGNLLETIYDVLFHPQTALRSVAAEKRTGAACIVVLLSVFLPLWAVYLGLKGAGIPHAFAFAMLAQVLGNLIAWVLGSAVLHLIAEFFGGRGTALGLLSALGFAHIPRIFIVPLWVIGSLLPAFGAEVVIGIAGVAIVIWSLFLDVWAISAAHELSRTKAVLILLTPMLVIMGIVAGVIIVTGMAFAHFSLVS